ncbi:MAG: sugar 3,4-ketoisomerase [Gammaproteobacteria bacterium]
MTPQFLDFRIFADSRGALLAAEGETDIPFRIARVYYLFNMPPGARRGRHAHRALRQAAVCLRGRCDILLDGGKNKTVCRLDSPAKGVLIEKMVWRELFNFSPDCLLAVFADAPHDESDYIRDYGAFLAAREKI